MLNALYQTFFSVPTRAAGSFYLYPARELYADMSVVGIARSNFVIKLYVEKGVGSSKFIMVYNLWADGERTSRQVVNDAEKLVKAAENFDELKRSMIQHNLYVLDKKEGAVFYNKLEEIWWGNKTIDRKQAYQELIASIDFAQLPEETTSIQQNY